MGKMLTCLALTLIAALGAVCRAEDGVVTAVGELTRLSLANADEGRPFDVTAVATGPCEPGRTAFTVADGASAAEIFPLVGQSWTIAPGDRIRVRGRILRQIDGLCRCFGDALEILGHGPRPAPIDATAEDIYSGRLTYALVRVRGAVKDAFRDEANPTYAFLALATAGGTVYMPSVRLDDDTLARLQDATVSVVGICTSYRDRGPRAKLGYEVYVDSADDITILRNGPADPFDVPPLAGNVHDLLRETSRAPFRRRIRGQVLAAWQGDRLLLRTESDELSTVRLAKATPPPLGETIDAAGLPETDFYQLNLSRAIWRKAAAPIAFTNAPPETLAAEHILTDESGRRRFNIACHGRTIRLRGTVRNVSTDKRGETVLLLGSDDVLVPVYLDGAPADFGDVEVGCTVEATGVCIRETENWRPQAPFPHISGMSIATCGRPDALRVLSHPPWLTAARLLALLGFAAVALVAVLLWNLSLNRRAKARGRELAEEQLAHVSSQLKVNERTRLAVELHDALSQTLTGVSMQIDTASGLLGEREPAAGHCLGLASRTIDACRAELRNTLWDLRSAALDETDMDAAIRRTLRPCLADTSLTVRFNVPRELFTDNTAHAVLKIIRELTVNAVRHGDAATVWIAGAIDGDRLVFSVRDDGRGFDPASAPGVANGHFGLQGIAERLARFDGALKIDSAPGRGAKVTVTLPLPRSGE